MLVFNLKTFIRCSPINFKEVLGLERIGIHHRFNISSKHLPVNPSNLLKSELNLTEDDTNLAHDNDAGSDNHEDVEAWLSSQSSRSSTDNTGKSDNTNNTDNIIDDTNLPNYSQVNVL